MRERENRERKKPTGYFGHQVNVGAASLPWGHGLPVQGFTDRTGQLLGFQRLLQG